VPPVAKQDRSNDQRGAPLSASCWISSRSLAVTPVRSRRPHTARAACRALRRAQAHGTHRGRRAVQRMNPADSIAKRSVGLERFPDLGELGIHLTPAADRSIAASQESRRGCRAMGKFGISAPIRSRSGVLDWMNSVWRLAMASGRCERNRLGRGLHRSQANASLGESSWLNLP